MESEFDDFDTNFDDELGKLLKPDLSGFNAIPKSTPSAMNLSNKLESIREQDESTDKWWIIDFQPKITNMMKANNLYFLTTKTLITLNKY